LNGIGPGNALFAAAKGSLLAQTGDFKSAVKCYAAGMDSNADKLAVINNLGFCFETSRNVKQGKAVRRTIGTI
jgi:hypothetical protein